MNFNKIGFALLFVAIAAGVAASQLCKADVDMSERPLSQLVDIENRPVDFNEFKGKVVVVNNWASWCPPCVAEMPSIQDLKTELNNESIAFVMVSFDEDHEQAKDFMRKRGYDLNVYFPGKNYPFVTSSIPVTFILDKNGSVVLQHEGILDYTEAEFVEKIKALIN
jgi:thiol-disulfide isomerase/thioredoxin